MVRASLNPPSSLANILRGRFPWWRDYEHPSDYESLIVKQFEHAMDVEPREHGDLYFHYRSLSLGTNNGSCFECRISTTGAGLQLAVAVRQYLDVVADIGFQPGATPVSSRTAGGSLTTMSFGVRSATPESGLPLKSHWLPDLRATRGRSPRRQNRTQTPAQGERTIFLLLRSFLEMCVLPNALHFG